MTLVDTGEKTMTGGRLKRVANYLTDDDAFCLTYGDGVRDIDVTALIAFHRRQGTLGTVTATYPPGRLGAIEIRADHRVATRQDVARSALGWGQGSLEGVREMSAFWAGKRVFLTGHTGSWLADGECN